MAAETVELDKDAFMRLVTEEHLQVEGPSEGYLYTGKRGRNGWELYKTWMGVVGWDLMPVISGATADPAAGASPAAVTVPAGKRWLLIGGACVYDVSADAATRLPAVVIKSDGTNTTGQYVAGAVVANEDSTISFGAGVASADLSSAGTVSITIPVGLEIAAGGTFQLVIAAIHANDNAGPLYYYYKEAPA